MAIAEDFWLGPAHVTIHDDYCVSEEEAQVLLDNIARIARRALALQEKRRLEEERKEKERFHEGVDKKSKQNEN